ncbi:hypothetical protein J1N09_14915 [Aureitalea sp. L0-47]|uniref:DUF6702 family protein n=1 Tax=Aureitalea sp. L0-47 TaxID=2816962 RepID=UPI00223785CE|nr:DUF6702 family protein [Aureitalea sp. L0-47]MCW5521138.1 hypothetical protein [Aureitalea sp. L0-47]
MKIAKILLLLITIPLLTSAVDHKFYASITKIEYVKEKQSLQIISKIFVDDLEDALQERYDKSLSLNTPKETDKEEMFLKEYLNKKIEIAINGNPVTLNYIGREYDIDIVKVYLEVTDVSEIKTLEVSNEILMEMFEEQQNIIHFKSGDKRRSLVLEKDYPKGMLNFN